MCATELSAKAAKSTCRTNILCKGEPTLFAHKCKFIFGKKKKKDSVDREDVVYICTHTHTPTYTSLVVQMVKKICLQCRRTWVRSMGLEDPLEKGMATHSSILARRITRTEEPGGLQFMGSQRVR